MPSVEQPAAKKKIPVLPLVGLVLVGGVVVVVLLRGLDPHALAALPGRLMGLIRNAGPWAFFAGIAILPAFGAPLMAFTVTAGEAFSPLMTMPGVIAAAMAAIAANLALTYWMARYALRPCSPGSPSATDTPCRGWTRATPSPSRSSSG